MLSSFSTIFALAMYDAAETPFRQVTTKSHLLVVEPEVSLVQLGKLARTSVEGIEGELEGKKAQPSKRGGNGGGAGDSKATISESTANTTGAGSNKSAGANLPTVPTVMVRDTKNIFVDGRMLFDFRQIQRQSVSQASSR